MSSHTFYYNVINKKHIDSRVIIGGIGCGLAISLSTASAVYDTTPPEMKICIDCGKKFVPKVSNSTSCVTCTVKRGRYT